MAIKKEGLEMDRSAPPTSRDLRSVKLTYLGRIRGELAKAMNAKTHKDRGVALDQATKFFERLYKDAKDQGPAACRTRV